MKLSAQPTNEYTEVNGVAVRIWKAITEAGVECDMLVFGVRVADGQDPSEFEVSLRPMVGVVSAPLIPGAARPSRN